MDTKQNKQLVMQGYQLFQANDIKGLLALFRDDIEWIVPEIDHVPFSGTCRGKSEVGQFFQKLELAQEAIRFEPTSFTADEDRVIVTGISRWHVKATGRDYDDPWVHVFTVRDGKIAIFQEYDDTAAAEAAYRPTQAGGLGKEAPLRH